MHPIVSHLIAGALTLQGASAASAAQPSGLAPTSKWIANFDVERCTLQRAFGTGDDQVVLNLQTPTPGNGFRLTISGRMFARQKASYPVKLSLDPDNPGTEQNIAVASALTNGATILQIERATIFGQDQVQMQDQARSLLIVQDGGAKVLLDTGAMSGPLRTLNACNDSLLSSWALDPADLKRIAQKAYPSSNPAHWYSAADFPSPSDSKQGSLVIDYIVLTGTNGKPSSCKVLATSTEGPFQKKVGEVFCFQVMRKARFSPARDSNGTAVNGYWISKFHWMQGS